MTEKTKKGLYQNKIHRGNLSIDNKEKSELIKDENIALEKREIVDILNEDFKNEGIIKYEINTDKKMMDILNFIDSNQYFDNMKSSYKNLIYHCITELSQNMLKYNSEFDTNNGIENQNYIKGKNCKFVPKLIIKNNKESNKLEIYTENYIFKKDIDNLKEKIDNVNNSSLKMIKEKYKLELNDGKIGERGGAGLGFLDMGKKIKNKLGENGDEFKPFKYKFSNIEGESEKSLFNLITNIPLENSKKEKLQIV